MATPRVKSLKLMIDTQEKRVLFGEANKDCADFLRRILSLPVDKVVGLVGKKEMVDSVAVLYEILANPPPKKCYKCRICPNYERCLYFSDDPNALCPNCRKKMDSSMIYVAPGGHHHQQVGSSTESMNYMVLDDLVVKPMSSVSCISLLTEFNVKDFGSLQEKVVDLGTEEAVRLLKAYFETKNVLTNVFLQNDSGAEPLVGKRRRQSGPTLGEDGPEMSTSSVEEIQAPARTAVPRRSRTQRKAGVKKEEKLLSFK